jgi:DNA-binding NtrC family response regulator
MTQQPRKKCRIFVVHDEPVIASSLAQILSHEGFEAKPFTEPLEALEAASSHAPDILISDVGISLGSGIELAAGIQKYRPGCKVLLFSTHASPAALGDPAVERHGFELIQKPVHPTDLLKRLQVLLENNPNLCGSEKLLRAYGDSSPSVTGP